MSSVQVSLVREFRALNEKLDQLFSRSSTTKLSDYRIETMTENNESNGLTISYMCKATYCGVYKFTGPLQLLEEKIPKTITSSIIADKVKLIDGKLIYNDITEFYISSYIKLEDSEDLVACFSCDASIVGETVPQLVVPLNVIIPYEDFSKYTFSAYKFDTRTNTVEAYPALEKPYSKLFAIYLTPSNLPPDSGPYFYVESFPATLQMPDYIIPCYRFAKKPDESQQNNDQ